MAKKRKKNRVTSKIDELPEDLKRQVDLMLMDTSNTYFGISTFLKENGCEISKSSVGRYAMRSNTAVQRLLEAQAQTEKLVQIIQQNPESDFTGAANIMLMNGLVNKLATAEEEFNEMPLDKAGRLIASITRTQVYKDRVRQDMQKKAELAFKEMEENIMQVIKQDSESVKMLQEIMRKAKERMLQDE